jgi:hypothetical protein
MKKTKIEEKADEEKKNLTFGKKRVLDVVDRVALLFTSPSLVVQINNVELFFVYFLFISRKKSRQKSRERTQ